MPELKLPPAEFMGCKGFKLPGPNAMRDMQATFDVQRSEMDQHKNARTGELAKGETGTGDTPCFEVHFDEDAQSAVTFAYAELIANVFDVPVTAGLLDDVDIAFHVGAAGAITITRGDGEGLAGFAPTKAGITLWNMSTPFSPAALVRGGKTRPKLLTKKGTGGFNYGLKQLVKNCLGDEIQPEFQFVGYVQGPTEGEAADDTRPPAGAKAMTTYRWVPLRKNPNTIKFKEDPLQRVEFDCNVPIVVQRVGPETWRTGKKKFPEEWLRAFCKRQWKRFAAALSTFMRVYKCDRSAGPCMRGVPHYDGGVNLGSPEILHRDCFSLLLADFAGYKLELPPGPLLLVGERFYQIVADADGLANLVLRIPGKGMNGTYKAFYSEARRVTLGRYVELLGTVIVGVINAAESSANPETLAIRKELATQLMPLLINVDSPVFGKARDSLMSSLMNLSIIRSNINPLRNLLIREVLRGSPDARGLSEQEFEAKIAKNPIVHSGGDVLRASVLADLIGTFQVPVKTDEVHPLLYRSTNMQMAERRAAEAVHFHRSEPPPALPEALQPVAEFVLGKDTDVAYLPLPAKPELAEAAVPFRHDDDAEGIHLAVLWQRPDAFALVKQVCDLRVVGVKGQMERADAVRQALNAPECLNQELKPMCEAILTLVRKDGAGYSSDSGKKDKPPDLKEWQQNALSLEKEEKEKKKKRERGSGSDSDSDSSSSDDEKLSTRNPYKAARKKKKKERSRAPTPVLREPPPFVAQPGRDGVQDGGGSNGVKTVVSRPGGKCHHREPLPGEPDVLTHLNQKPVTIGGETVYVPSESAFDGAEFAVPEGFVDRFNAYKMAKFAIVRRIGITARVMPTWSPAANWSGIALHGDNLLLVNLPLLKTRGQFEETILHEMAHDLCARAAATTRPGTASSGS